MDLCSHNGSRPVSCPDNVVPYVVRTFIEIGRVCRNDAGQPHGACLTAEPRIRSGNLGGHADREAERPLTTFQIRLKEAQ